MACKRSAVRSRLPPPTANGLAISCVASSTGSFLSPSSRGLGHHPFTVSTGVRIPLGTPGQARQPTQKASGFLFEDAQVAQCGDRKVLAKAIYSKVLLGYNSASSHGGYSSAGRAL